MATHCIKDKIICIYKEECSGYSIWVGDGKHSDCISCRNNAYEGYKKKNFYKPKVSEVISKIILGIILFGGLFWSFTRYIILW